MFGTICVIRARGTAFSVLSLTDSLESDWPPSALFYLRHSWVECHMGWFRDTGEGDVER